MEDTVRLLMIEFAATRGFQRAELFPLMQGLIKEKHQTLWLRFGVDPANMLQFEASGVELDSLETKELLDAIDNFEPTHVLFSLNPSPNLVKSLANLPTEARHAGPEATLPDGGHSGIPSLWKDPRPFPVPRADISKMAHLAKAVPDYHWIPGNAAAKSLNPLPYVISGEPCLYSKSFKRNPFFTGLEFTHLIRPGGCAFCLRPPNMPEVWKDIDSAQTIKVQIEAIGKTCPRGEGRQWIRMQGEAPIRHIVDVAKILVDNDLPPSDLLFDIRADRLVNTAPNIRRALQQIKGSSHRIEICLLGIENFATSELNRLNKGLTSVTNLKAIQTLFQLERDFPQEFGFRQHGGISLITFTPWTTPQELFLNLSVCKLLEITSISGKLLSGRLRLYPGLPLYERAKADGLLREQYDDPLMDTSRLNLYEPEAPWAFADPIMQPICQLLIRMENDQVPEGFDELTTKITDITIRGHNVGVSAVNIALQIIKSALSCEKDDSPPDLDYLLEEALSFVETHAPDIPELENWAPPPPWDSTLSVDKLLIPVDCLLEIKPSSKIEPVSEEALPVWQAVPYLPNLHIEQRRVTKGSKPAFEVFFGKEMADVQAAVETTIGLHDRTIDQNERSALTAKMGRLLGYPGCCADTWAKEKPSLHDSVFWLQVERRISIPGAVPFEIGPASLGIEYVPCSLTCEESLNRASKILQAVKETNPEGWERHIASLKNPYLIFATAQGSTVELIPESTPGERFKYTVGRCQTSGKETNLIELTDELVMEGETLLLLRKGRPFLPLSGKGYLWWYQRPFQTDFWTAMIDARSLYIPSAMPKRHKETPLAPVDPEIAKLDQFLMKLFNAVSKSNMHFSGYGLTDMQSDGQGQIFLDFTGAEKPVKLVVDLRQGDTAALSKIGKLLIRHPEEHPLRSPTQWRVFHSFMRFLRDSVVHRKG